MENSPSINVTLYDDSSTFRCSLSKLISLYDNIKLLGAYPNPLQIIENCRFQKPDVILMDINMPGMSGIEAVKLVTSEFPTMRVLMLTVFDDNLKVFESICNGAVGYILKNADPVCIIDGVKAAHNGGAPMSPKIAKNVLEMFRLQAPVKAEAINLSDKEKEILSLLTRGYSYKMIAAERDICIDTVRFHIKRIYEELHVHSMTEAVSKALKNKYV